MWALNSANNFVNAMNSKRYSVYLFINLFFRKRLRKSDGMKFGNDVYSVTFCTEDKHNLPLFGAKYDFHLEGVVDCPEGGEKPIVCPYVATAKKREL